LQGLLGLLERVETQAKSKGEEDPERQTKASQGPERASGTKWPHSQAIFPPLAALSLMLARE